MIIYVINAARCLLSSQFSELQGRVSEYHISTSSQVPACLQWCIVYSNPACRYVTN